MALIGVEGIIISSPTIEETVHAIHKLKNPKLPQIPKARYLQSTKAHLNSRLLRRI